MPLLNLVRKKILGKGLYDACKKKDPRVNNDLLIKRLKYLHEKGAFNKLSINDMILICELKSRKIFAMDKEDKKENIKLSGQEIKIMEDYYPLIQSPEIKEEIKEESYVDSDDEQYEMVLLKDNDCMMFNVIDNLHKLLILRNTCFLQGAFVFSDQDGKLFDRLIQSCNYNYRRPIGQVITHDVFINPKSFESRGKKSKLDQIFLKEQKLYYPNAVNNKFYMYEIPIQDKKKNPIDFNYACDEKCREDDSDKTKCPESIKQTKRILLLYPFQVNVFPEDGSKKISKRYLYIKLEDSHAISTQHMISSFQAYVMPKLFSKKEVIEKKEYPIRRERKSGSIEKQYDDSHLKEIDDQFYNNVNVDLQEVTFYNIHVRNHHEFFIPQNITNAIISDVEMEES